MTVLEALMKYCEYDPEEAQSELEFIEERSEVLFAEVNEVVVVNTSWIASITKIEQYGNFVLLYEEGVVAAVYDKSQKRLFTIGLNPEEAVDHVVGCNDRFVVLRRGEDEHGNYYFVLDVKRSLVASYDCSSTRIQVKEDGLVVRCQISTFPEQVDLFVEYKPATKIDPEEGIE